METCWTLIRDAAAGDPGARDGFASRYQPVVRAYLAARWKGSPHLKDLDDAAQDVFLQCFQQRGALERVDAARSGGFRAFLYGVVQRVAQSFETRNARQHKRQAPGSFHPDEHPIDEASLSRVFDRAWARSLVREAGDLNETRARERGGDSLRRVELLRLRFTEGKPIRDIAAAWQEDPKRVHWEYARARNEFRDALRDVLGLHERCPADRLEQECERVLELLR